jgi:hypothetical protein
MCRGICDLRWFLGLACCGRLFFPFFWFGLWVVVCLGSFLLSACLLCAGLDPVHYMIQIRCKYVWASLALFRRGEAVLLLSVEDLCNLCDVFDGFGFGEGEFFVEDHGFCVLSVHSGGNRAGTMSLSIGEEMLIQSPAYSVASLIFVDYNRLEFCDFAFPVDVQIEAADDGADQFSVLFGHENAAFSAHGKSCEDVS